MPGGIASAFIESLDLKLFENYLEKSDNRYSKFVKMIIYYYKNVNNKEDRESYFKLNDLLNNPSLPSPLRRHVT